MARNGRNGVAVQEIDALRLLQERRKRNLRQRLQAASRIVGARVLAGLIERGYDDVRLAHVAVLSYMDLEGSSISVIAERANMTTQGISQIARELVARSYVTRRADRSDGRARILAFSPRGWKLLMDSFEILDHLEAEYEAMLGARTFNTLRSALSKIVQSESASSLG